jgi:RNA polymerase sigma-70 factor (ECF subfamily)
VQATTEQVGWNGLCEHEALLRGWLARRCRDGHELDDVLQDTLLRAARFRNRISDPNKLRGWLIRIAANALRDRMRREGRTRAMLRCDDDLDLLPAPEYVCEATATTSMRLGAMVVSQDAAREQLERAMATLRAGDRRVLLDHYAADASCAHTAQLHGVSTETLKMRLFRARRRLLRALESRMARVAAKEAL